MPRLQFNIPNGYTVTKNVRTVDLDEAVAMLCSRKRKKYVSALRPKFELVAELRKDEWVCPFCGHRHAATLMADSFEGNEDSSYVSKFVDKRLIKKWSTRQMSIFSRLFENLPLNPEPHIRGEQTCPKCRRTSVPFTQNRDVCVSYCDGRVEVKAEICGLDELLSLPWSTIGPITLEFPIYELVIFELCSGHTYVDIQFANGASVSRRDITCEPCAWKKGVVYQLLCNNTVLKRTARRVFSEIIEGEVPFAKSELTPEKYILMTRFVGFGHGFYDAIPYARGTFEIEKTFADIAQRIHTVSDAVSVFDESRLPKCKSVRRIFFSNPGLIFYIRECEELWMAVGDVNHYHRLMVREDIFELLSLLHQRPILLDLVYDYAKVKGVKTMISQLLDEWRFYVEYALDYCTMNASMKLSEQKKWTQIPLKRLEYADEDELDEAAYYRRRNRPALFSIPMRRPYKPMRNCVIDGFSFEWLRSGNEYYAAGKALCNCLGSWNGMNNPVVAIRMNGETVAAVEVGRFGVMQARGDHNSDVSEVIGLGAALQKWMKKYSLKDLRSDDDDLPF